MDNMLKVGMIGLDTSHVIAFTEIINDSKAIGDLADVSIVAGFPGGNPDFPLSRDRVEGYTQRLREMNIEIVGSIAEESKRQGGIPVTIESIMKKARQAAVAKS